MDIAKTEINEDEKVLDFMDNIKAIIRKHKKPSKSYLKELEENAELLYNEQIKTME
ncbi:hypothetical protein [Bacillus methanolicus]|uniref:hypothetical protein n=1 Tax=Bacillus methanolicus TaxID=1471 RepID=UPI002380950A|nr:hypothetical protein [Bacillus methanolicus]